MLAAVPCPDASVLQQFALGHLPPEDVEPLARHVEHCDRCTRVLDGLKAVDPVVAAVAAQPARPGPHTDPAVDALIERLKRMPPPAEPDALLAGATGPETPSAHAAACETPPPANAEPAAEADPERDPFLSPAQAPGELGWLGSYRILQVLGTGGMGVVYRAEDTQLQRPVALKVMKPELARYAGARERFLREARAAAQLRSDHVVTIHQVGEDRQVVFLAMELLEGQSLAEWLKERKRPTLAEAARVGRQIALGLAAAHERGLIHRDVKPGNVWLEGEPGAPATGGRVKLLDFGLARAADDDLHLTRSGAIVGTPAYMAPEQARGDKVDHRCDLFSLGVLLYQLCTGRLPFRGDNVLSLFTALAVETPKPPRDLNPDIPPRLATLIEHLLAKDREQRPKTARAVADELAAVERDLAAAAARPARQRPRAWRRVLVAAGVLALLGGATAAVVVIVRDRGGKEVARVAVPEGGSAVVKDDAGERGMVKEQPPPKGKGSIPPGPLPSLEPGEPLSPLALVQRPTPLPGVRGWSILTRDVVPSQTAYALAYRPDGQRLAVGGYDGSVQVYDPHTGRLVQALLAESMPLLSLTWSPDGAVLAGGSQSDEARPVHLWDAETGRLLRRLESPRPFSAHAVAWSPDGRSILAFDEWTFVCLAWNAADGKLLREVAIPCAWPVFSPDGSRVAGVRDHAVVVWDTEKGQEVRRFEKVEGRVAWSPDGKYLACPGADALHVWDMVTGKEILARKDLAGGVYPRWSPDGRTLALGRREGQSFLLLEVAAEGATEQELDTFAYFGVWAPDGKTIALMPDGGRIDLFDVGTGQRVRSVCRGRPSAQGFAWSPDGQTVAVLDAWQRTFLMSADSGRLLTELSQTTAPLGWSPDGKRLAAAGPDHAVVLWDAAGRQRVALVGHQAEVTALAWSPDGKYLASAAAGEKRVLVWDAEKGQRFHEPGPFAGEVESHPWHWMNQGVRRYLSWSPDGRLLACHVQGVGWHVWDVEKDRLANEPKRWQVAHFDFAPDGRSVLVYSPPDGAFELHDLATGERRGRLSYQQISPVWSPDGRLLAVPWGPQIELWRPDLTRRVRTLTTTYRFVSQVAFAGDGKLVAALAGGRLHIWETASGRLRGILLPSPGRNSLTVTPEGPYAGAEEGIVVAVQKGGGESEVLEPADFERRYGFRNEPGKVHLLQPLPPSVPPEPVSPLALVQEPARLPGVRSWTLATRDAWQSNPPDPLAYRPDGKRLAAGSWDGSVRVFEPQTGRLVQVLLSESAPVTSLAWSRDGRVLAAGSQSYEMRPVHLWEAESGRLLCRLEAPLMCVVFAVSWSADGRSLLGWGNGGCLVWEAATGKLLRRLDIPCTAPYFSPDGKQAAGVRDQGLLVWDTETGRVVRALGQHQGGLAWSPDGKRLACAAADALFVWQMETGQLLLQRKDLANAGYPQWSPDGKTLALPRGSGHHFQLLDLAAAGGPGREFDAFAWSAVWSPDGKAVALKASGQVDLFDVASARQLRRLTEGRWGPGGAFAWSPDARTLAVVDTHGRAYLASAETGEFLTDLKETTGPVAWSPDGKHLAAAAPGQAVLLWDSGGRKRRTLAGHQADVTALAWSPDGKYLASAAAGERRLLVWDAEQGRRFREIGPFATEVQATWNWEGRGVWRRLTWSPDGKFLAFNLPAVGWHVWDVEQNRLANDPRRWQVASFDFAPDGHSALVYLEPSGVCQLRDLATGEVRGQHSLQSPQILPVWSPGGHLLAVPFGSETHLWRADLSGRVRTLTGTYPYVTQIAFSGDGNLLAVLAGERLHFFETDTGRLRGMLLLPGPHDHLAVSPDGHYRGSAQAERNLVIVVQKEDGTSEVLEPADFERRYGFKNDPDSVHLLPP